MKKKIHETITEQSWTKGSFRKFVPTIEGGCDGLAYCAAGWLNLRYQDTALRKAYDKFRKAIGQDSITAWNDSPIRTFDQVQNAFRLADL